MTAVGFARARAPRRHVASLAVPALLVVVSILQSPGRLTFDTDLGLALDPAHLLGRAFHLWSGEAGFGGVGDQTYGFLFPMGPFFALGHLVDLPAWLVERLWCALVLVLAYEGTRRLVRRLVSPRPFVGVVAGVAFALSPRMLTVVGPFSSEALAVALAPWLLLPLVVHLERDVRRAAWLSGLVVLGLGAVNAAATLAVLPLPFLYLFTRPVAWRRRWRSLGWWSAGVLLGALWWIGPLLLLGAYSPPFTDWVESARTTTDPVSGLATLRGATDWVAYVPQGVQGFWPAGWDLATSRGLVVVTLVVAVFGVAGLASRSVPERQFLLLSALVGFTLLTMAHEGSPGGPLAAGIRDVLDRQGAPFRNIYKFDPVLHLPLVLGLAHLLDRALALPRLLPRSVVALGCVGSVLLGGMPAYAGDLRPGPGFTQVPTWWKQAAAYVATDGVRGRTLLVPEATTGRYTWGRTIGEPLEALARSPWAVRNQVPLTLAGNTRLVDAVESVLASGRGSPVLADVLARSGVGQVLVRNDLDRAVADTLPAVRVRQALDRSPGMRKVAAFGPRQRFGTGLSIVDGGIDIEPQALEVWVVDRAVEGPHTAPLSEAVAVSGGPEDLLPLMESGLVRPDQPTVLAGQVQGTWQGPRVVTDGLQRRERSFGRVHRALGPLLTADEDFRQTRVAHDLLPFDEPERQATAAYDGAVSVTASTSVAYPDNFGGIDLTHAPAAATDGNPTTSWFSGALTRPVGQWLEVRRTAVSQDDRISLTMVARPDFGPLVTRVRLRTERGSVVRELALSETPQELTLPTGAWSRLRVTVLAVAGTASFGVVGIRELTLPGAPPVASIVAPSLLPPGPVPAAFAFHAVEPTQPCVVVDAVDRCDSGSADPGEESAALDRTFTVGAGQDFGLRGTVLPTDSQGTARLLRPLTGVLVATASSSLDGTVGPMAAVDGNPSTSWVADPLEPLPALGISWPRAQTINRLVLVHGAQPAASVPVRVHVHATTGDRDAVVGPDGQVSFASLRTNEIVLSFPEIRPALSTSSRSQFTAALPVGVVEVQLPEVNVPTGAFADATPTGSVCGFGPVAQVDGRAYPTQVRGTIGALRRSAPLELALCGPPLHLGAGRHRLRISATAEFRPRSVVLAPLVPTVEPIAGRTVTVDRWGPTQRRVTVQAGQSALLVVPEAANPGWRATLDGHRLVAQTVDGWQQGWVVPAGPGGQITLDFTPDRTYRWSLLIGALAVLLLLGLAWRALVRPDGRPEPVAAVPVRRTAVVLGLAALCALAGGWVCLAGLVAGLLLTRRRRLVAVSVWALPLAATVLLAASSRQVLAVQNGVTAQTLSLLAIGLLASLLRATRD